MSVGFAFDVDLFIFYFGVLRTCSPNTRYSAGTSTLEEIDMQWVWLDDSSDFSNFLLAKRFPLEQKQKLRIIEDCTAGGLNQTCGSQEKLKIHAIDELIAYLSWSISHYGDPLVAKLVGKTFDLTSAYKQLASLKRIGNSCE